MTISREIKALCNRFINSLEGIEIDDLLERLISNKDEKLKFEEISELRKELASAKTPYMLSLVETFEESQEPVVVFSAHTYPIEVLQKRKGWKVITGSTSNEDRAQAVKLFQEGKLKGIGATIKAGGVGLTLTNAHQAVFVDLDWTPAMNLQAEDRLCRIGQTKGVIINRIVADHILDQRIMSILIEKKKLLESVSLN
jgi:SNF2 family DNA or RNA helicase